jgi:hypothetical protein
MEKASLLRTSRKADVRYLSELIAPRTVFSVRFNIGSRASESTEKRVSYQIEPLAVP